MEVLEDDDQRLICRDPREQPADRVEDTALLGFRLERWRRRDARQPVRKFGHGPDQLRCERPQPRFDDLGGLLSRHRPQQIQNGRVWQSPVGLEAHPLEDQAAELLGAYAYLRDEAALPDPGLAADQHGGSGR